MSKDSAKKIEPNIEASWKLILKEEFQQPYFAELKQFLLEEKKRYEVYPPSSLIFNAFDRTPFANVKVVILGQDPYHGPQQAHGLSFSVPEGVNVPPSLKNIYKELHADVGFEIPSHGNLEAWAEQGVLLLNATLTVRRSTPGSHQKRGWEQFTDATIRALSDQRSDVVFLLWGNYARAKRALITSEHHLILEAPHPSPYSAASGFFGCKHFSRANEFLTSRGKAPINWDLS